MGDENAAPIIIMSWGPTVFRIKNRIIFIFFQKPSRVSDMNLYGEDAKEQKGRDLDHRINSNW